MQHIHTHLLVIFVHQFPNLWLQCCDCVVKYLLAISLQKWLFSVHMHVIVICKLTCIAGNLRRGAGHGRQQRRLSSIWEPNNEVLP